MPPSESNASKINRAEFRAIIEKLIRTAIKNKAAVIGFVFSADPPLMVRFGNVKETGPDLAELFIKLSDIAEDKESRGQVIADQIKMEE